jgi:hypothetical protein
MSLDPFVLCGDAWLARVLGKNLQTAMLMLLAYGTATIVIVGLMVRALMQGHLGG